MATQDDVRSDLPAFTPGPWRAGIAGNNRVYGPDCAGEDTGLVAVVYKGAGNKHLISAAPELYEYVESSAQNGCATAQALIARARGDQ